MKLQLLGTAAAEGIPGIFCDCPVCQRARRVGGREIRTRAGAMIDGVLKLDFGPDSYYQMLRDHLDYAHLSAILITHSHSDHFAPIEMEFRYPGYAAAENQPLLTVYGNDAVGQGMARHVERGQGRLAFQRMIPFEPVMIQGYRVTALEAVHCIDWEGTKWPIAFGGKIWHRSEQALFYLIEKDGKSILYAHDTCEFSQDVMDFLAGRRIDLISLDCTGGLMEFDYEQWIGHMAVGGNLNMRRKLMENGAADGHTVFVANHFSHNGYASFEEIQSALPGFLVGYDSMTVEV